MGALSGSVKPERISASTKVSITANEILATATYNEAITVVTKHIYQALESEKSTVGLIEKIVNRLGLKVQQDKIDAAIKYLEMRHIFIHEDGKPNKSFKARYPDVKTNIKGRIDLSKTNLHEVRDTIIALISTIDKEMMNKKLIIDTEIQP